MYPIHANMHTYHTQMYIEKQSYDHLFIKRQYLFGSQFQRFQLMVSNLAVLKPGLERGQQNKTIHFVDRKGEKKRKGRGPLRAQPQ